MKSMLSRGLFFFYIFIFVNLTSIANISHALPIDGDLPVAADWGHFQYITDTDMAAIYVQICATDSILHVYSSVGPCQNHFVSYDDGDNWSLLDCESDRDVIFRGQEIKTYFGHGKFYTVYAAQPRTGGQGFTYFKASTDYGQTWSWSRRLATDAGPGEICCNITGNGDTVLVFADDGVFQDVPSELWKSYDAGHTWERFATPIGNIPFFHPGLELDRYKDVIHVSVNSQTESNSSYQMFYWRSTDIGNTWEGPTLIGLEDDRPDARSIAMESDGMGNVVIAWTQRSNQSSGFYCRISHDEGLTWQPAIRLGDQSPWDSDITIRGNYVGAVWYNSDQLLYRESFDGGTTWENTQQIRQGFFGISLSLLRIGDIIHIVFIEDTDEGPRAGYIRYDPMTGIWDDERGLLPDNITLSAYPNPFNPFTTISYDIPKVCDVTLAIFDILGRKVATLANGLQAAGHHSITWSAYGLASGQYFVRLEAGENMRIERIILLK